MHKKFGASKIFTFTPNGSIKLVKSDSNNFTLLKKGCTTVKTLKKPTDPKC